ncbi:GNAT family N-acetyltransferase [Streptomyces sp. ISL-22]|uniref:GNAT family N-acetyltransferase n=1 Tax=unclassified Streptomyces TaxID=2593676 RepID=UPI001BE6E6F7|nr:MULTISPECIES: GNAT family N-acetyltransferase [unclassified Streptomyces]MBT2418004.1 GNAT family N-acetyltransferase [Streptomyces sp. ISL-24]MBT2432321.1 GNAT family N-acetyltransferase [Streptomyces sp. ISL-22]
MAARPDLVMRAYTGTDEEAVRELIDADRLPGQPGVSGAMLAEALAGRSPVDAGWWEKLERPRTWVAVECGDGGVVGVVSYALEPGDGTGYILWLHCREDRAVADALVAHAVGDLSARSWQAFQFASALTRGLEGLPVGHRPATRAALEAAGFEGADLWRYMRAPLPSREAGRAARVRVRKEDGGLRVLRVYAGVRVIAEAEVGEPEAGVGVLWWLHVDPRSRGRGLGRGLLGSALALLGELGATEAILYVDDDAPPGDERDRTAAGALYDSVGFVEVDRLHSFTRTTRA